MFWPADGVCQHCPGTSGGNAAFIADSVLSSVSPSELGGYVQDVDGVWVGLAVFSVLPFEVDELCSWPPTGAFASWDAQRKGPAFAGPLLVYIPWAWFVAPQCSCRSCSGGGRDAELRGSGSGRVRVFVAPHFLQDLFLILHKFDLLCKAGSWVYGTFMRPEGVDGGVVCDSLVAHLKGITSPVFR